MKKNLNIIFLFLLILMVGIQVWLIFKPFLLAILLAFLLSQFFKPWYLKIKSKIGERPSTASVITCILIFVILILPIIFASTLVVNEAKSLNQTIEDNQWEEKIVQYINSDKVQAYVEDYSNFNLNLQSKEFVDMVKKASNFIVKTLIDISSGTIQFISMIFFMFFTLYYLFKDGERILKRIMKLSPLRDKQENLLLDRFISISKSTIKGSLVVAAVQGFSLGVLFALTGVPSAAFWGFVAIPLSLIPFLGSFLIWMPAAVIQILVGNYIQGVIIIVVGAIVIGNIDNLLRAKLVGDETKLHQLLVFFSTIGGIGIFGPLGFIIGPVIVVLFKTLMEIYEMEFKKELSKFNK